MLYVAKEAKKMRVHINDLKDELERYEKYMNNFKEGKFTLNFLKEKKNDLCYYYNCYFGVDLVWYYAHYL